jgi:hypothetical protein
MGVDEEGRTYVEKWGTGKKKLYRYYLDEGKLPEDVWTDIQSIQSAAGERVDYPTQKPAPLIERVIKGSSREGDLVADFFCGSGTTSAVAEKFGRKWIAADLGKFAIHTTRKRMIGVQRQLKSEGKNYRAFEILNLGKYERQHLIGYTDVNLGGGRKIGKLSLPSKTPLGKLHSSISSCVPIALSRSKTSPLSTARRPVAWSSSGR